MMMMKLLLIVGWILCRSSYARGNNNKQCFKNSISRSEFKSSLQEAVDEEEEHDDEKCEANSPEEAGRPAATDEDGTINNWQQLQSHPRQWETAKKATT